MQPHVILNSQLAGELAKVGHGDTVLITDAGFPIPRDANVVELGLTAGTIDVLTILKVLREHLFCEKVRFAPEVKTEYPSLYKQVQEIYTGSGAVFEPTPHEALVAEVAPAAKLIIRSGSLTCWGNFALTAATDPFAWCRPEENIKPCDITVAYEARRQRMTDKVVPDFAD
jgi:D-ribose pyranose/furanose isomerase RbsD